MSDNITLPREVVQDALDALTGADDFSPGGTPIYMREITALRTALAAEQPKPSSNFDNQGAVLLLRSKSAEIERLKADSEALRRDAERYRWLRGEHSRIDPCIKANAKYRLERDSSTWVNIHDLDAAIDAAMGDKT